MDNVDGVRMEERNMYQSILDEATAQITIIDTETYQILYANRAALEATKDMPGTYIGSVCYEFIQHSNTPCPHCMIANAKHSGYDSREVEFGNRTYNQLYKMISWNGKRALMEYTEDITEQKQNMIYAEERRNSLNNILTNIPTGIVVYQYDGTGISVEVINPAMCKMLGISPEEAENVTLHQIMDKTIQEDRHIVTEAAEKLKQPDIEFQFEYRSRTEDLEFIWLSAHAHTVKHPTGAVNIYVSYSDITEKKKLDQVKLELDIAQKASQAKSEFLTRMSHDIRTPMNAIINMTRFAREDYLNNRQPDVLDDLGKVENTSNYLLGLINDILDVSRIESGKLELNPVVYDYEEFASYISCMIKPLCEKKNIQFTWDRTNPIRPIYVDKVRFNQLMFNLLSNAVKYTPEGGRVALIENNSVVTDQWLCGNFSVVDTGCGMSKKFQKKMFEPFAREQSGDEVQGTGLGLTIVKRIIDVMGGTLEVESQKGIGSTFTVSVKLPYATKEQIEEANRQKRMVEMVTKIAGKCILIAEDHPLNMKIIVRLLSQKGIKVVQAINGQEVVEIFKKSIPGTIDAILMDLRMPLINGIEATELIRSSQHPDAAKIPIIAMTANAFEEDRIRLKEAGMTDYLTKPIEPDVLYKVLVEHIS